MRFLFDSRFSEVLERHIYQQQSCLPGLDVDRVGTGLERSGDIAEALYCLRSSFDKYGSEEYFSITRREELFDDLETREGIKSLQKILGSQKAFLRAEAALNNPASPFYQTLLEEGSFGSSLCCFEESQGELDASIDGDYGHSTRLAVAYWQFERNQQLSPENQLEIDGVFGLESVDRLQTMQTCKESLKDLEKETSPLDAVYSQLMLAFGNVALIMRSETHCYFSYGRKSFYVIPDAKNGTVTIIDEQSSTKICQNIKYIDKGFLDSFFREDAVSESSRSSYDSLKNQIIEKIPGITRWASVGGGLEFDYEGVSGKLNTNENGEVLLSFGEKFGVIVLPVGANIELFLKARRKEIFLYSIFDNQVFEGSIEGAFFRPEKEFPIENNYQAWETFSSINYTGVLGKETENPTRFDFRVNFSPRTIELISKVRDSVSGIEVLEFEEVSLLALRTKIRDQKKVLPKRENLRAVDFAGSLAKHLASLNAKSISIDLREKTLQFIYKDIAFFGNWSNRNRVYVGIEQAQQSSFFSSIEDIDQAFLDSYVEDEEAVIKGNEEVVGDVSKVDEVVDEPYNFERLVENHAEAYRRLILSLNSKLFNIIYVAQESIEDPNTKRALTNDILNFQKNYKVDTSKSFFKRLQEDIDSEKNILKKYIPAQAYENFVAEISEVLRDVEQNKNSLDEIDRNLKSYYESVQVYRENNEILQFADAEVAYQLEHGYFEFSPATKKSFLVQSDSPLKSLYGAKHIKDSYDYYSVPSINGLGFLGSFVMGIQIADKIIVNEFLVSQESSNYRKAIVSNEISHKVARKYLPSAKIENTAKNFFVDFVPSTDVSDFFRPIRNNHEINEFFSDVVSLNIAPKEEIERILSNAVSLSLVPSVHPYDFSNNFLMSILTSEKPSFSSSLMTDLRSLIKRPGLSAEERGISVQSFLTQRISKLTEDPAFVQKVRKSFMNLGKQLVAHELGNAGVDKDPENVSAEERKMLDALNGLKKVSVWPGEKMISINGAVFKRQGWEYASMAEHGMKKKPIKFEVMRVGNRQEYTFSIQNNTKKSVINQPIDNLASVIHEVGNELRGQEEEIPTGVPFATLETIFNGRVDKENKTIQFLGRTLILLKDPIGLGKEVSLGFGYDGNKGTLFVSADRTTLRLEFPDLTGFKAQEFKISGNKTLEAWEAEMKEMVGEKEEALIDSSSSLSIGKLNPEQKETEQQKMLDALNRVKKVFVWPGNKIISINNAAFKRQGWEYTSMSVYGKNKQPIKFKIMPVSDGQKYTFSIQNNI